MQTVVFSCYRLRFYSGYQKNVPVFKRFFLQPLMPHFRIWVFSNRVQSTRLHPHRLRHCRAFVFSRLWRKNPSHLLRGWPVALNIIMESGITRNHYDFYLCGQEKMIRKIRLLVDEQFPGFLIFREVYY
jgi:hypothetical protein